MPRRSPSRPTASQPSSFLQNFIDAPIDSVIETRIVHEKALESTDLEWLFGSPANSPRFVGISPAYSKSGSLPALACALGNRVLVVNFYGSKSRDDGSRTSGARPRDIIERRNRLEQELLCHPDCTLYSFDLATFALSLHLHFQIHLANAIDIQSALNLRTRSPVDSVRAIVGDQIFPEHITSCFETTIYGYDEKLNVGSLVQMAWLCGYLGQYDLGDTQNLFHAAPKVDTRNFSADELRVLQKMSYDAQRLASQRPTTVTHEVQASYDPETQQVFARSQNYQTRVTRGTPVTKIMAEVTEGSVTFSIPVDVGKIQGKTACINTQHNVEGREIAALTSVGRGGPSRAESDRSRAVLRMLQGSLSLLDNHWSDSSPPIEIFEHPEAPLNASQRSARTHMLSPSLTDCITLIQGPPGTGKTTVIASYVENATRSGHSGIWLLAQSNVAVKNIAEKLAKFEFLDFRLIVSQSFHFEWHEHLYKKIEKFMIRTDKLREKNSLKKIEGAHVILCTLDTITSPALRDFGFTKVVPVNSVVIDEASQIEVGQYLPLFEFFGELSENYALSETTSIPPHGNDTLKDLRSVFDLDRLQASAIFLNVQYRMPPQIGDFISRRVYKGKLQSYSRHPIKSGTTACHFVDIRVPINRVLEPVNLQEVEAVTLIAKHLENNDTPYKIVTPYEAQRKRLSGHSMQKVSTGTTSASMSILPGSARKTT
ncbi:P-loop containing nucleoside triphosphate hydrolase protein [Lactarius quietus]|nr:P-loop containing nucleoside triphosphate hydrolase protein [Lactarius quietus]